jgi:hypothetical protein
LGSVRTLQHSVFFSAKRLPEKQVIWKENFYGKALVAQEHTLNKAIISAPTRQ